MQIEVQNVPAICNSICNLKSAIGNVMMRLCYSCHDSFPSSDTNTQQIFWTLLEVARLGVEVELCVPSVETAGSVDARAAIAAYYGAAPPQMSAGFTIVPIGGGPVKNVSARGWFDWRVPKHLASRPHNLIWTRDPLAVLSCVRAGQSIR